MARGHVDSSLQNIFVLSLPIDLNKFQLLKLLTVSTQCEKGVVIEYYKQFCPQSGQNLYNKVNLQMYLCNKALREIDATFKKTHL